MFAGIIAILMYNKSKIAMETRSDPITSYAVAVSQVRRGPVNPMTSLVGTVTANHDVAIAAEASGKVTGVFAEVGDYKKKGDVLIQLDDELKHAAFTSAEVNYDKAKKDFERFDALARDHSVTDQQFETARLAFKTAEAQYITAKRQYNDTRITTPISGIVTARQVDLGSWVANNAIVANVVDLSILKIKVNIAEADVFRLHHGDPVDVSTDVYPGVTLPARVSTISAKADEAHTYPVEVLLNNNDRYPLKAGMFARIVFRVTGRDTATMIPRMALVGSVKQAQVYVVGNGIARLRPVVLGGELGTDLQVLAGVAPGETVVVNGQVNLKDSTAVTIAE